MVRKASSLPARNRATSCSSERSRSKGAEREILSRWACGAESAEASTAAVTSSGDSNSAGRAKVPVYPEFLRRRSGVDVHHHVLDLGVVLERVHGQVLAVAGLLEAAVGHLRDQRDVVVDPHTAEAQRFGYAQRAPDIARPHRRGEA